MGTGETTVQQSFLSDWLISMSPNRQGTHQARIATHMYVRRVTARFSSGEKTSLRQCIRPFVAPRAPGQDEFCCVSVLTSRSVVEDHYRYQVADTPCDCSFVLTVPVQTSWKIDCSEGVVCARPSGVSISRQRSRLLECATLRLYVLQRGISNRPLDDRSVHDQVSRSGLWRRVFGQQPNAHLV